MNQLASLGFILLLALVAGHLVKWVRVPEVTGYILMGVLIGPSVLSLVSGSNLAALGIFSDVALGLILFSIGSIFEVNKFRHIGRDVIRVAVTDAVATFLAMLMVMKFAGQSWQASAIIAAIAIETAAASTLMVIRELNAEGPLTDAITGTIALNNVICLTTFTLVVGLVRYSLSANGTTVAGSTIAYEAVYRFFWQILGSAALGYLVGLLLGAWSEHVHEQGEILILLIGCVLLTVGLALVLHLSTLVASLAVGATAANYSETSRRVFRIQSRTDPPFYAIFFVLAGANLHISLLKTLGIVGIFYFLTRGASKVISIALSARRTSLSPRARSNFPLAMFSHAGLAIGLVLTLERRLPEIAAPITTIVLSSVLIYELIGPLTTKFALLRAGEAQQSLDIQPADLAAEPRES